MFGSDYRGNRSMGHPQVHSLTLTVHLRMLVSSLSCRRGFAHVEPEMVAGLHTARRVGHEQLSEVWKAGESGI